MRFYIAANFSVRQTRAADIAEVIKKEGYQVNSEWINDEPISAEKRHVSEPVTYSTADRDLKAIQECDVFVLIAEPADARSLYVEFGFALAMRIKLGKPAIYVLDGKRAQTIFYSNPLVSHVETVEQILIACKSSQLPTSSVMEGKIEEYRALRAEMLQIISERLWGPATYVTLCIGSAGLLGLSGINWDAIIGVLTYLPLPFMFNTLQREKSRFRLGSYLRTQVEQHIPGMGWETHVDKTRRGGGNTQRRDSNLSDIDQKINHLLSFYSIYFISPIIGLIYTCSSSGHSLQFWILEILGITLVFLTSSLAWQFYGEKS